MVRVFRLVRVTPKTQSAPQRLHRAVNSGKKEDMRFPFRFAAAYRLPALAVRVTPITSYVDVGDTERTGGFAFLETAGPPHLSFSDLLLDPTGRIEHPGATLTVAEPPALVAALERAS